MKKRSKRTPPKADAAWPDNPVVNEVRAVRAAMWKEAGGSMKAYLELARREAAEVRQERGTTAKRPRNKKGRAA